MIAGFVWFVALWFFFAFGGACRSSRPLALEPDYRAAAPRYPAGERVLDTHEEPVVHSSSPQRSRLHAFVMCALLGG